ncbi:hypothetical protein N4R57_16740 [Rhodobacteraceae bacterium D3-12]|nr:hypothetical protein N4R57_16740 [Rhodobacteraceae bacterium D3-12]
MDPTVFISLGERLTKALITHDFELYQQVMDLPLTLEPRGDTSYTLTTADELRTDFDLYCDHIRLHEITDIYREAKEVETLSDDLTVIVCETHILSGGSRVVPPFTGIMTMHRCADDVVRFSRIQSSPDISTGPWAKAQSTKVGSATARTGTIRKKPNGGSK